MRLVEENGEWRIEGEGHERARVAYASEKNGRLEVAVESSAKTLAGTVTADLTFDSWSRHPM